MNFLTRKITSRKVRVNDVNFSIIKTMLKKVCGNDVAFSISKIMSIKVRGNYVDILISEITSKKYVEMRWKFIEIWSLTYRRNIDVESTWI